MVVVLTTSMALPMLRLMVETVNHFLVRDANGQYVNRLISTADLSNGGEIILRDGTDAHEI